jgi:hypothetical protein
VDSEGRDCKSFLFEHLECLGIGVLDLVVLALGGRVQEEIPRTVRGRWTRTKVRTGSGQHHRKERHNIVPFLVIALFAAGIFIVMMIWCVSGFLTFSLF